MSPAETALQAAFFVLAGYTAWVLLHDCLYASLVHKIRTFSRNP